jgi:hypothetical protein
LTAFRSSKGTTPTNLFQVSTSLEMGHSAVSFASSFWFVNDAELSASAGGPACAVILYSESMVKVAIATPSITLFEAKGK